MVPQVDIDVTKLSVLSPEVISQQVSMNHDLLSHSQAYLQATINIGAHACNYIGTNLFEHISWTEVPSVMSRTVNRPSGKPYLASRQSVPRTGSFGTSRSNLAMEMRRCVAHWRWRLSHITMRLIDLQMRKLANGRGTTVHMLQQGG